MASNKEILRVEIDTAEFDEFRHKFDLYEAAVKAMPGNWRNASAEIITQKTNFEKMVASVDGMYRAMERATIAQSASSRVLEATGLTFVSMWKSGKHFKDNIVHATQSLNRWTKLTAIFSGLLGAGGLFGINRMATSVAGQRTSATGLGISYGEQASFLTNFGRLGNAEGILQGFSEAETDVTKKWALRQYLGHTESGDPAKDFAEGLPKFKQFVDQYKNNIGLLGPQLEARGYGHLGITTETARIVQGTSAEEIAQISGGYQSGIAGRLGLDPDTAKKWTDFTIHLEKAGREVEIVFAKGVKNLINPLGNLSGAVVHLTETLLKEDSLTSGLIKDLGKGIKDFADELGSGQGKVAEIGKDISAILKWIDAIVAKAPNTLAVATGIGVGARFGGTAVAAGTALARSRVAGAVVRAGASAAGYVAGEVAASPGALAVGGLLATTTPLNKGEDEQARQRRFHEGRFAPEHMKQRHKFGHPHHAAFKPGAAVPVTAEPGSPWNRISHPRRYQGQMTIGTESFDYASGSESRGRGSSPFGDHQITYFDPSAMHGRGGGAFRTQDVYDPQTGDRRGAVEIHVSRQDDVDRIQTAGCFGIPQSQWASTKRALQEYMRIHGGATLRVSPSGHAEVIPPGRSPLASYASGQATGASSPRRRSFGHPHMGRGHHPATIGRKQQSMNIEDHTGGMVHVASSRSYDHSIESGERREREYFTNPIHSIPPGSSEMPKSLVPVPERQFPHGPGNLGVG